MSEPVSILFTIPNFETAGSGSALLNVASGLDRAKFAPSICSLRPGGHLEAEIARLGFPYFHAPFTVAPRPLGSLFPRAWKAARVFRERRFTLWHSFHYLDDYTEPLIARMAGVRGWIYTKKNMGWNHRSWFLRTLLASGVAAQNSTMIRDFFSTPLFRGRAALIPPGVDIERFRPDTPPRLGLRARLGIRDDAVVVACVAQMVPVKGHPTLLEAVSTVPGVIVWLAGRDLDQEYASALKRDVQARGLQDRVFFLGEIRDVPALLAEADIFALPTWNAWRMEGCPIALLEALSSGRACVATDIPGVRDVLVSGSNGIIVPPRDAEALAQALRSLAEAPQTRRALGSAGRERAVGGYSIEREVRDHERLYSRILDGRARPRAD